MHDLTYNELVHYGIAKKLQSAQYFDKNNNIVLENNPSVIGTNTNIQVTDPVYFLFVDKTGLSTNMKMDKKGTKGVIAEKIFMGTKKNNNDGHTLHDNGVHSGNK
jgi:hypothetical protein